MARRISELENISEMDQTIRTSIFNPENPAACVSTSLRKHLKSNTSKDSYYLCENGTALKIVFFVQNSCVVSMFYKSKKSVERANEIKNNRYIPIRWLGSKTKQPGNK
jgi:hypothetical protein